MQPASKRFLAIIIGVIHPSIHYRVPARWARRPANDRGQMVLPKDIREKAKVSAGEKLAVVLCTKGDSESYICLIKVENLGDMVMDFMGPMAANTTGKD